MSNSADASQIKSTSLYVGDLHPLVTDALLFTKFADVGPVVNARVCRDMVSRTSLGYGYVNFRDPKDAENALEGMNYGVICGRPFRLMWSQKDPTLRKSGKGNIFIKNLEKSITSNELYDTFEQFGKILSCKLSMDDKNLSKGFGFVHYESEESAQKAIQFVNGREIRNRIVYVGPFVSKRERQAANGATKFNNCYVKNFGEDMDDARFKKLFEKFGEIKSACVMKNEKGVSKGFGFVCFEVPSSAESAVKEMDGYDFNGKQIYVGRAQRKEERKEELAAKYDKQRSERQKSSVAGVNLYVKNIDDTIDDEQLREAFSSFGEIASAKVMRDTNGISRSFGFVCFRTPESAAVAVTSMNGEMLGKKPVYVAIAQRKEDRRAKLSAEYHARMEQMKNHVYMPNPMSFIPGAAATAGYQGNRSFYQRPYANNGPRWQQTMLPTGAIPMPGSQHYQANLAAQNAAGNQGMQLIQQNRYNANPNMAPRIPGMNVPGTAQMSSLPYNRQAQPRQLSGAGAISTSNAGMQNRVPMGGQPNATGVMGNRSGAPMGQQTQNAAAGMPNRGNAPIRGDMPQASASAGNNKVLQEDDIKTQKNALGHRLFDEVKQIYPEAASKLTGIILSMEINSVKALFGNKKELEEAIHGAYSMMEERKKENEKANASAEAN